jgi:hypothetical protein
MDEKKKEIMATLKMANEVARLLSKKTKRLKEDFEELRNEIKVFDSLVKSLDEEIRPKTQKIEFYAMATNDDKKKLTADNIFETIKRRSSFSWKATALKLITDLDEVLSTELIYELTKETLNDLLISRVVAIRSYSSALFNLVKEDQSLQRTLIPTYKGFLYGLPSFFENGVIKSEYLEKLRNRGVIV